MAKQSVLVVLACAILSAATSARAQDDPGQANSRPAVEITPFVFLGSNASSGVGAAVRWPTVSPLSFELETTYRPAETNALGFNLSMLYDLPRMGRATPYVAAGVGLDQYNTAEFVGGRFVAQRNTAVTVNAGGGLRVQADENWGIRTDARWVNGLGRTAPEKWRLYNGVTFSRTGR